MAKRKDKKNRDNVTKGAPLEQLRTFGDPTLKQKARDVTEFDARLRSLSDLMLEIMERESGVGLAGPQIGTLSRIIVWRDPDDEDACFTYVNPDIVERSEGMCTDEEGCLSVPGFLVRVERHEEVTVRYQDVEGDAHEVHLSGYPARVVQHEIDHLEGFLILDRCSKDERRRVLKEMRERAMDSVT